MSGTAVTIVLGFLLATAFGAFFHLIFGGPAGRIVQYILASCVGFLLGHLIGSWLNIDYFKLGPIYLLSASVGSWMLLMLGKWLWSPAPLADG